eukprot:CAMPEP_0185595470 /NCGR_PEP_ID=MMETSP0434-20130131/78525_1 /TAXON_ID=626734 ORGANISM="Favella taraikaensis, Strain Fe Narragansett Bay" /NCGR_SAMPLE_ID=MMETSP0434 /ASSEMBLY_ACC=CAM_ASM_000379 /LENGTH=94 /DNA_ID=CAMNT_0028223503 /DNA_START=9 /DNA_END=289 /DNA_ORIENTATION=-
MPLMGWLSAADTLTQLPNHLSFKTREEAIAVAERCAFQYEIVEPIEKDTDLLKSYAFNFLPEAVGNDMKKLGPRKARKLFRHPTSGGSHWINRA